MSSLARGGSPMGHKLNNRGMCCLLACVNISLATPRRCCQLLLRTAPRTKEPESTEEASLVEIAPSVI